MSPEESIKRAIAAIGEGKPDDYVIAPASHAEEFKNAAPTLSAILNSSAISTTARQYEDEDREAVAAQQKFKRTFKRANTMVLLTGILIALVLAIGNLAGSLPGQSARWLLIALGVGSVITGGLATKDLFLIKQGKLLEDWMSRRAFAETTRLGYFSAVAQAPAPASAANDVSTDLLKLEYFRRFQLDVQRAFYRQRSKQHSESAGKTLALSGWTVAGAAVFAGVAGVLAVIDVRLVALAALGTACTGISSYAATQEAVSQDRRNAERYQRTSRVLDELYKRLDDVRAAVAAGGGKPLKDFIEAVHEQLSLEHRQWLGELNEIQGPIKDLENTLQKYATKPDRQVGNQEAK